MRRAHARVLISLVLLVGCTSPPLAVKPRQAEATRTVWVDTFGATTFAPPPVEWATVECYNKADSGAPRLDEPGIVDDIGRCVAGIDEPGDARIEWLGSFHRSAFAHELLHAWQGDRGFWDGNHTSPEWKTILPAANAALEKEGL